MPLGGGVPRMNGGAKRREASPVARKPSGKPPEGSKTMQKKGVGSAQGPDRAAGPRG